MEVCHVCTLSPYQPGSWSLVHNFCNPGRDPSNTSRLYGFNLESILLPGLGAVGAGAGTRG